MKKSNFTLNAFLRKLKLSKIKKTDSKRATVQSKALGAIEEASKANPNVKDRSKDQLANKWKNTTSLNFTIPSTKNFRLACLLRVELYTHNPSTMYTDEPPFWDMFFVFLLHAISSSIAMISEHALYFLMGINTWAMHFLRYLFLFLTLLIWKLIIERGKPKFIQARHCLSLALSQLFVTSCISFVHNSGRNGDLYAQRISDFGVTVIFIFLGCWFLNSNLIVKTEFKTLLLVIGVATSLSWGEKVINFSWTYLAIWPVLVFSTACHYMLICKTYKTYSSQMRIGDFTLNMSALTSVFLAPGAIIFTKDCVTAEWYNVSTYLEISDYAVLLMTYVSTTLMMYTKYWLMSRCNPETYLALWHCKYLAASIAKMFIHYFVFINPISGLARLTAIFSLLVYARRRQETHMRHIEK